MNFKKSMYFINISLKYNENSSDTLFAKALLLLRNQNDINYKLGWELYENRWHATNELSSLEYNLPFYNGEDLTNKTILIQEEQGFGDNIQFIRYIDKIKSKNPKKIYVAVRKELVRIFELIPDITIVRDNDTIYDINFACSLLSMPRVFNTSFSTIPNTLPYLGNKELLNKKAAIIQNTNKLKIGFAYQGNTEHSNDKYRSIQLEVFKSLFELKDVEFYNLQVSSGDKKLTKLIQTSNNLFDATIDIEDFYDSAIIINNLDLIISIDSALAHFAGALNKKTFLLLPRNSEWRWFDDIDYSPWYPCMKLYRQKELGLWTTLIEDVKKDILKF